MMLDAEYSHCSWQTMDFCKCWQVIIFLFLSKPLHLTEFFSKACAVLYSCEFVLWEILCLDRLSLNSLKFSSFHTGFLFLPCYLQDPSSMVWPLKSLATCGSFGQNKNTGILKDSCSRTVLLHNPQVCLEHLLNGSS